MKQHLTFIELKEEDLHLVKEIYDYYTLHTTVVYFLEPVSIDDLRAFIPINNSQYRAFILQNEQGERCGFCYYNKFRPRAAFSISVELTIYLKPEFAGRGYGYEAVMKLEEYIRKGGFTNIVALVAEENSVSQHLFTKCGYSRCGIIKNVARKFEKKLGLIYYQKEISPIDNHCTSEIAAGF